MMSKPKITSDTSFDHILKFELKKEFEKRRFKSQKPITYYNDLVRKKVEELKELWKGNAEIMDACFLSYKFKNYINWSTNGIPEDEKKHAKSTSETEEEILNKQISITKMEGFYGVVLDVQNRIDPPLRDFCAICIGYNGFRDFFKRKNEEKENGTLISEIDTKQTHADTQLLVHPYEDDDRKAEVLRDFFKEPCYLYVYDQNASDDRKINVERGIDAVVIYKNKDSDTFSINNLGYRKEKYDQGILEWGDEERKTFNINFKKHKRNLYLRFHFADFGGKTPEIILGKYIFSMGTLRQVVSGTAMLSRELDKPNKEPFNYDFTFTEKENSPPFSIQAFLAEKIFNFQKLPARIYDHSSLDEWLEKKYGENIVEEEVIKYEYLITYPISSFNEEEREELYEDITNILQNGISIDDTESDQTKKLKRGINDFCKEGYSLERKKSKIIIYPKHREAGYDPNVADNESFNNEFLTYLRRSRYLIVIYPEPKDGYKRPSSVFTFTGFCVPLGKKVFIFYKSLDSLPVIFQKPCRSMGIYPIKYENLDQIPLYVHRELRYLNTKK